MTRPSHFAPNGWAHGRYRAPRLDTRLVEAKSFLKNFARSDITASALAAQFNLRPETAEKLLAERDLAV